MDLDCQLAKPLALWTDLGPEKNGTGTRKLTTLLNGQLEKKDSFSIILTCEGSHIRTCTTLRKWTR